MLVLRLPWALSIRSVHRQSKYQGKSLQVTDVIVLADASRPLPFGVASEPAPDAKAIFLIE